MKKFLSILLVLVLVASLFTGCDWFGGGEKQTEAETEAETNASKATLEKAVEYLATTYKSAEGKETSNNYELIPQINIDGVSFIVTWTVDNENITITKDASGFYIVNLPSNNAEKCEYTLTATVTAPDGKTATKTMKRVLPVISKVEGVETDLQAETAYKLFFDHKGVGKVLFLTAETSGNYIKTVVDPKVAADFFAEAAEGGFKVYTLVNGAKNYIKASTVPKDDGKVSKVIGFDAAGSVFKYNKEINAWYTTIDGVNYTMGTYGTYETVSISEDSYYTPENTGVSQFPVQFIAKAAGEAMAPSVGPADPTELTPIADAVAKGLAMEHNTFTVEKYLVKGTVTEIANTQYGNLYIEDAEGNKIYIYGLYNNDGSVRFDAMTTQPKVGDVITVMSVIGQYNDAAQLKNAWLMNIEVPELSDADKVAAEKDALSIDADGVVYLDTVITLPTKGASHDAVTITWAAPADYAGTAVAYDATTGKLTVTIGDAEETYKLTATIKCGEVTDTKEVTLTIAKKAAYTVNVVSAPVANTAYKLYFKQLNAGKVLFVNGEVDGRYLKTTMNVLEAVDVYAEAVEGGYKFYTLVDGAKAYLNAYLNDAGKSSVNFAADSACVFAYNAETYAWEVTVGEKTYYAGSYNAFETVSLSETKYINAENTRTAQFPLELVEIVCAHDFDEAKCESTCTICGAVSEPNHKYDNACDAKCNVCDAEREVPAHVYDNACDAKCNVCDAERSVADHVYDNACDAKCNVCDAERQVADHVYDDVCDAQCNECKAERTAPHAFAKDCEEKCDKCGATRTTETKHTYDFECDKACKVCGETRKADCVDKDENGTCDVCQKVIDKAEVEKNHIAHEKEQITFVNVKCDALTVTLPTVKDYEDVTITWTCEKAEIKDGKITFTAAAAEQTITLVATFKCGETTETAEYTVKVLGHTFEQTCSETCKVCGAENVDAADHTWGEGCVDTACDVCGAERTAGQHAFENNCESTKCKNCDYNRDAAQHVYADDCTSTKCQNENCDVARDPAEHVWANCDATKCTNCAVTRTAVPHVDVDPQDDKCDKCAADMATFPKVGVAYKWYIAQNNLGKILYFNGEMAKTYYFGTTENYADAVDMYFEKVDGGYNIYFEIDGVKKYISVINTGSHYNVKFDQGPSLFVYNEELNTMVTSVEANGDKEAATLYIGTYAQNATFSASTLDKAPTSFVSQFTEEEINSSTCTHEWQDATCTAPKTCTKCGATEGDVLGHTEPAADGTCTRCGAKLSGATIKDALEAENDTELTITGTISKIYEAYSSQHNNISFYLTDDNGDTILCYRVTGEWAVGDIVKVTGKVTTYSGAKQIAQGGTAEKIGTHTNHIYIDATCTDPKTCKVCGATDGSALGHNYIDGVCDRDGCGALEPVGDVTTVTTKYEGATSNMSNEGNNASTIGLDSSLFTVTSDKCSASNEVGLNKAGDMRLYFKDGDGTELTFAMASGYTINSIKITFTGPSYASDCQVSSNNSVIMTSDGTATAITVNINASSFVLKNVGTSAQVRISNIEITYSAQ